MVLRQVKRLTHPSPEGLTSARASTFFWKAVNDSAARGEKKLDLLRNLCQHRARNVKTRILAMDVSLGAWGDVKTLILAMRVSLGV